MKSISLHSQTGSLTNLLHIAHRQISKHATLGFLQKVEQRHMLFEIDKIVQVSPEDVLEDSKAPLAIDFSQLS